MQVEGVGTLSWRFGRTGEETFWFWTVVGPWTNHPVEMQRVRIR